MSEQEADDSARISSPPPTYLESGGDIILDPSTSLPDTSNATNVQASPPMSPTSGSILSRSFGRLRRTMSTPISPPASILQTVSPPPPPPPPPPVPEPVVLTWQPPPGTIQDPVKYTFSSIGPQSMVLMPLTTNWDSGPLYYISWREDYFSPGSIVTTIRKGANENAPFLAEFGLGAVRFGSTEHWMNEKFIERPSRYWIWLNDRIKLKWTQEKKFPQATIWFKCTRFSNDPKELEQPKILASLKPPEYHVRTWGPSRRCELKLYPEGQDKLDDILISALMLERQRLDRERSSS